MATTSTTDASPPLSNVAARGHVGSRVEVSFLGPYEGSTGTPFTLAVCVEYCTGFTWVLPVADSLAIECHQLMAHPVR